MMGIYPISCMYMYIYIYTYMDILAMMGILYTYTGIIGYKGNIMGILLRETEWMEYTSVYHTPHMFPLCPWPKPSTGPTGVWSSGRRAAGAVLDDVASDAEHRGGELTADGCDMTSLSKKNQHHFHQEDHEDHHFHHAYIFFDRMFIIFNNFWSMFEDENSFAIGNALRFQKPKMAGWSSVELKTSGPGLETQL